MGHFSSSISSTDYNKFQKGHKNDDKKGDLQELTAKNV